MDFRSTRTETTPLRDKPRRWLAPLLAFPLCALLLIPLLALLLKTSPALLVRYFGDTATVQAIGLSLATSLATLIIAVGLGTPLAQILARRQFRGRTLLETLIDLPTVLPPAAAGIALLAALGRRGLVGRWLHDAGMDIPFTPMAVVIAQTFVASPYYIKSAAIGLAAAPEELHAAAALDGASPSQVFRYVSLPLAWRGILGGAALCWARALGEFGATIIFAGNYPGRTQTMPIAIYIGFQIDMNQAITLAAIMLVISLAILLAVRATLEPKRTEVNK